jgi:hypothetical protein
MSEFGNKWPKIGCWVFGVSTAPKKKCISQSMNKYSFHCSTCRLDNFTGFPYIKYIGILTLQPVICFKSMLD